MALMMAAYAPDRWAGVSSWVPIADLARWHGENGSYAPHVEACCGGRPGTSSEVDGEYHDRSPLHYAREIAKANVSVHHGRYDRSVPYGHTWDLAQAVEGHAPERFFFEIFDGGHELCYPSAFQWFDSLRSREDEANVLTG
jgi:dipeptidyl aminopeptidase/acylaminoacyl peptidase